MNLLSAHSLALTAWPGVFWDFRIQEFQFSRPVLLFPLMKKRKYTDEQLAMSADMSHCKSRLMRQIYSRAMRAAGVLMQDEAQFSYLFHNPKPNITILGALGFIDHPAVLRSVATAICDRRMSTPEALALTRRVRGKDNFQWKRMAGAVRTFSAKYFTRYPAVPPAEILAQIHAALFDFESALSKTK